MVTASGLELSYRITATLDPERQQIDGSEQIAFCNRSTKVLRELRLHLYLNAFSGPKTLFMRSSGGSHRGLHGDLGEPGSIHVSSVAIDASAAPHQQIADGTVMRVVLGEPYQPGRCGTLTLGFSAHLPRLFARTGRADDFFMIAQWYPKLGFLHRDGSWRCPPFHAFSEFFAPFADYRVSLVLPARFVVGSSGVITRRELPHGLQRVETLASRVHDVALAAWPYFRTMRTTLAGVPVELLSVPGRSSQRMIWLVGETLRRLQRWFGRYPYPKLTVVDVPTLALGAHGMEYPTLITTWAPVWAPRWLHSFDELTVHEITHQYFQTLVATNEIDEPWLDEGLTTYVSGIVLDDLFGADRSFLDLPGLRLGQLDKNMLHLLGARGGLPLARASQDFPSWRDYGAVVYGRSAALLYTLQSLLGRERMVTLLGSYARQYAFRHPTRGALLRVIEKHTPQQLRPTVAALLQGTVIDGSAVDYAVDCRHAPIVARRYGPTCLPVMLQWHDRTGRQHQQTWEGCNDSLSLPREAVRATVGPRDRLALDTDPLNNSCSLTPTRASLTLAATSWAQQLLPIVAP